MSDAHVKSEGTTAMVSSNEYQEHSVFKDLNYFVEFYEFLAERTIWSSTTGTKAIFLMDSQVFSSIQGTIDSIRITTQQASTLTRGSILKIA